MREPFGNDRRSAELKEIVKKRALITNAVHPDLVQNPEQKKKLTAFLVDINAAFDAIKKASSSGPVEWFSRRTEGDNVAKNKSEIVFYKVQNERFYKSGTKVTMGTPLEFLLKVIEFINSPETQKNNDREESETRRPDQKQTSTENKDKYKERFEMIKKRYNLTLSNGGKTSEAEVLKEIGESGVAESVWHTINGFFEDLEKYAPEIRGNWVDSTVSAFRTQDTSGKRFIRIIISNWFGKRTADIPTQEK